jgi:isopenicillin-N epimerase
VNWEAVRGQFMLAPDEVYLNAGTFSALPRPVWEELTQAIARAEANPTRLAAWNRGKPLWAAQAQIARYLAAAPEDIIFHINVTHALNQALFCLPWPRGGEFLVSDLEYGAIVNAAREVARRRRMRTRVFALPPRPGSDDEVIEAVLSALSPDTVGLLLSHVTTSTGLVTPVERLGAELRRRGVRFIVDGAHGPGLVPLDLGRSSVDAYGGNLHKWFMGPKGTAFLYVARDLQPTMRPHVVGWGGASQRPLPRDPAPDTGASYPFQRVFQLQGLFDVSPFLALPATLDFRRSLGEERIRRRIAGLCGLVRERLGEGLGLECVSPPAALSAGLVTFHLPAGCQGGPLQEDLYARHRITVAAWQDRAGVEILRVSPHVWNVESDIDRLAAALREALSAGP